MKHLFEFNQWKPDNIEVTRWCDIISHEYEVSEYNGEKIVVIDDKINWLTGAFSNKKLLTQRMFNDISGLYEHKQIHVASLRKAIKNWIDSQQL